MPNTLIDYFYNVSDTLFQKINVSTLDISIRQSSITKALDGVTSIGSTSQVKISFKDVISTDEKAELDTIIANHNGEMTKAVPVPMTSDNKPRIQIDPREGSPFNSLSVNWCDKTTWYEKSVRVVDEIVISSIQSGSEGMTYIPDIQRAWVDVSHGKITGERSLRSEYSPVIKIDDVVMKENSPDNNDDGDYSINYKTGIIFFNNLVVNTNVVKATYSYVTTSEWTIVPNLDKKLDLIAVEVQFSDDIVLEDTVIFAIYGNVENFAPQLLNNIDPDNITSFATGTKIRIKETYYQTMDDFVNEAQRSYSVIPQMGGNNWRSMKTAQYIFRWPYDEEAVRRLHHKKGMEIRIRLENDREFGGSKAVSTFYGISEDDK